MDEVVGKVAELLRPLTPEQRKDVLSEVGDTICLHCGYDQPKGRMCYCWNDE